MNVWEPRKPRLPGKQTNGSFFRWADLKARFKLGGNVCTAAKVRFEPILMKKSDPKIRAHFLETDFCLRSLAQLHSEVSHLLTSHTTKCGIERQSPTFSSKSAQGGHADTETARAINFQSLGSGIYDG